MVAPHDAFASALATALGSAVRALVGVSGGDINDAFEAELASGERLFVKTHRQARAGMFAAEAAGLDWLAEAKALRVPKVRAVADEDLGSGAAIRFLALEHIPRGRPGPGFDEALGRGLATLHRAGAPGFGWWRDNFIGTLPQANAAASTSTWAGFYRARRLAPQVQRAHAAGTLGVADLRRLRPPRLRRLPRGPPAGAGARRARRALPALSSTGAPQPFRQRLRGTTPYGLAGCVSRLGPQKASRDATNQALPGRSGPRADRLADRVAIPDPCVILTRS